ncbi:hypothetical protein QBC38DRAFT_483033 [Podospora fimiseda]|uniref:Uncharacterized protein n=1 Tax=Podospora fimiseda TaxID=252190 RepID=A0AAN7BLC9_9PEZI|nr:hypothetical protein QBC38DRAFT_483033 [Podospora fimiseda]
MKFTQSTLLLSTLLSTQVLALPFSSLTRSQYSSSPSSSDDTLTITKRDIISDIRDKIINAIPFLQPDDDDKNTNERRQVDIEVEPTVTTTTTTSSTITPSATATSAKLIIDPIDEETDLGGIVRRQEVISSSSTTTTVPEATGTPDPRPALVISPIDDDEVGLTPEEEAVPI